MELEYIRDITCPVHLAGEAGEVREIEEVYGRYLIEQGYGKEKNANERRNHGSKRPAKGDGEST